MSGEEDYFNKYMKYKEKYLDLVQEQQGGMFKRTTVSVMIVDSKQKVVEKTMKYLTKKKLADFVKDIKNKHLDKMLKNSNEKVLSVSVNSGFLKCKGKKFDFKSMMNMDKLKKAGAAGLAGAVGLAGAAGALAKDAGESMAMLAAMNMANKKYYVGDTLYDLEGGSANSKDCTLEDKVEGTYNSLEKLVSAVGSNSVKMGSMVVFTIKLTK